MREGEDDAVGRLAQKSYSLCVNIYFVIGFFEKGGGLEGVGFSRIVFTRSYTHCSMHCINL